MDTSDKIQAIQEPEVCGGGRDAPDELQAKLYATDDAMVWAEEFVKLFEAHLVGGDDIDTGLMVGWFANAMATAVSKQTERARAKTAAIAGPETPTLRAIAQAMEQGMTPEEVVASMNLEDQIKMRSEWAELARLIMAVWDTLPEYIKTTQAEL